MLGWRGIFLGGIVGAVGLGGRFLVGVLRRLGIWVHDCMSSSSCVEQWTCGWVTMQCGQCLSWWVEFSSSGFCIGWGDHFVVVVSSYLILGFAYSDHVEKYEPRGFEHPSPGGSSAITSGRDLG